MKAILRSTQKRNLFQWNLAYKKEILLKPYLALAFNHSLNNLRNLRLSFVNVFENIIRQVSVLLFRLWTVFSHFKLTRSVVIR